jgi:hypothetical protein
MVPFQRGDRSFGLPPFAPSTKVCSHKDLKNGCGLAKNRLEPKMGEELRALTESTH